MDEDTSLSSAFEAVPRRIFLDSCTVQTLRDFDYYIVEGEPVSEADRIHQVTDGVANLQALQNIFYVGERALFEWIVSAGSLAEARAKRDPGHEQWLWEIAHHSEMCLQDDGATVESEALAARLDEPKFGYLSSPDRRLLQEAVALRCDAFLTMERRLPTNAKHLKKELGIAVLTPVAHWRLLAPWAGLWR